ncbi:MAG: hypothetical protein ACP6IY_19145 [Promethearchaeia archaeon]
MKLLYDLHEKNGTLDLVDVSSLCPECEMKKECNKYGINAELNVYCLEGCFK